MPDDQSETIIKLLEEIRDLTKLRNEKLEAMVQDNRKHYDQVQQRVLASRRRLLFISVPLCLGTIGFMFCLAFWIIPASDRKQAAQQMQEYQMIQSNYVAQPHQ
ncbi:MAG TPA: hypothetical protein VNV43_04250 [Candidatus Acidoferrales bacterium]|jgi:hypothetical protein|nr:hypothetical protein [Candidatus Acidoferrales bacterium]